jgi:hypothetical protein
VATIDNSRKATYGYDQRVEVGSIHQLYCIEIHMEMRLVITVVLRSRILVSTLACLHRRSAGLSGNVPYGPPINSTKVLL